jgi:DNA repair exonuclease SbcCD ATPase subunit
MKTDDNSNLVDMDDLDAFETAFYEKQTESQSFGEDEEEFEEVDENESDQLATKEDENAEEEENETSSEDDETEEQEEASNEEEEEKPAKKNRKSAKERIDELTAERYNAQRELEGLRREFEAFKAGAQKEVKQEAEPTLREQLAPNAPSPDALDDKGEPVYPLGEFDPHFIRDLTKFTIEEETKAARARADAEAKASQIKQEKEQLSKVWNEKVEKVVEELPDFREKVQTLGAAFNGIDPQYGDYLATTIMQCDNGPEIMYYLSQNIGEAQNIVASGPFAATLAIGRLQAKLEVPTVEEEQATVKRVSKASTPPPAVARGQGGKFTTRPDTDDLDAFERVFYKK